MTHFTSTNGTCLGKHVRRQRLQDAFVGIEKNDLSQMRVQARYEVGSSHLGWFGSCTTLILTLAATAFEPLLAQNLSSDLGGNASRNFGLIWDSAI